MASDDPKPWQRPLSDAPRFRASAVCVLVSLLPLLALVTIGCAAQYILLGGLAHGMVPVLWGTGGCVLAITLILPRVNYVQFTRECFTLRELLSYKQIPWADIEPGSITCTPRTLYGITIFTTIGFRLKDGSRHRTQVRALAGAATGLHVTFVNLYTFNRERLVEKIRWYQGWYGTEVGQLNGVPTIGPEKTLVWPVKGDPLARGPRHSLIVLNDDTHSFDYVLELLQEVLGTSVERANEFVFVIDRAGQCVVFTGSREEVLDKRDRIRARGADPAMSRSTGPLRVEVVEGSWGANV
jgi:ATP-dependent Clp protease adaptor protein ClpS